MIILKNQELFIVISSANASFKEYVFLGPFMLTRFLLVIVALIHSFVISGVGVIVYTFLKLSFHSQTRHKNYFCSCCGKQEEKKEKLAQKTGKFIATVCTAIES